MTTEFLKATEHIKDRVILMNPLDTALIFNVLLNTDSEVHTSILYPRGRIIAMSREDWERNKTAFKHT